MMYAKNEHKYGFFMDQMILLFENINNKDFLNYFMKNWDSCKNKWTSYSRKDVPTLGNMTNNRVESSFGKIKRYLNRYLSLYEAVENLLMYQVIKEERFFKQRIPGTFFSPHIHPELNTLANVVSTWCFKLIEKEFEFAVNSNNKMVFTNINEEEFNVNYQNDLNAEDPNSIKYIINPSNSKCSCGFSCTYLLPCKHIMTFRFRNLNINNLKSIIPLEHLNERWLKDCFLKSQLLSDVQADEKLISVNNIEMVDTFIEKTRIADKNIETYRSTSEKYNEAMEVFKQLASTLCEYNVEKFNELLKDFKVIHENILSDGDSKIVFSNSTDDINDELLNEEIKEYTYDTDISDLKPNFSLNMNNINEVSESSESLNSLYYANMDDLLIDDYTFLMQQNNEHQPSQSQENDFGNINLSNFSCGSLDGFNTSSFDTNMNNNDDNSDTLVTNINPSNSSNNISSSNGNSTSRNVSTSNSVSISNVVSNSSNISTTNQLNISTAVSTNNDISNSKVNSLVDTSNTFVTSHTSTKDYHNKTKETIELNTKRNSLNPNIFLSPTLGYSNKQNQNKNRNKFTFSPGFLESFDNETDNNMNKNKHEINGQEKEDDSNSKLIDHLDIEIFTQANPGDVSDIDKNISDNVSTFNESHKKSKGNNNTINELGEDQIHNNNKIHGVGVNFKNPPGKSYDVVLSQSVSQSQQRKGGRIKKKKNSKKL